MRLQLTTEQVEDLVKRCGRGGRGGLSKDILKVLAEFRKIGHDPFTRKDVVAVLTQMGTRITPAAEFWHPIGEAIRKGSKKAPGRGFYTQGVQTLPAPEPTRPAPPEPPPAVRETPPEPPERSSRPTYKQPSPRDDRDEITWVVYELSSSGETFAVEGDFTRHFRQILRSPSHEVFVPYLSYCYDGRNALFNVMEGYVFVAAGLDERVYLNAVHHSPYLRGVLHYSGGNTVVLQTVPDSSVRELRDRLAQMVAVEIEEGMRVEITRGICQGLRGKVVGLDDEVAYVLVSLRTLQTIRTIPRFALLPVGDEA